MLAYYSFRKMSTIMVNGPQTTHFKTETLIRIGFSILKVENLHLVNISLSTFLHRPYCKWPLDPPVLSLVGQLMEYWDVEGKRFSSDPILNFQYRIFLKNSTGV